MKGGYSKGFLHGGVFSILAFGMSLVFWAAVLS